MFADAPGRPSPPPDLDEEPSDFEDELQAMMDIEAEEVARDVRSLEGDKKKDEAAARRKAAIMSQLSPPPTTPATNGAQFVMDPEASFTFDVAREF